MDALNTEYINSTEYSKQEVKLKDLVTVLEDLVSKSEACRRLRYAEVDIEAERESGRLQPDELYVPTHIIDTNIKREQSSYVQFVAQSPRAVITRDLDDPSFDMNLLDRDLTDKLRYDGWQLSTFANIDSFQANGYSIMEVVQDQSTPGEVSVEHVQYGDFAFSADTRDIQAVERTGRTYYFTRTRLLALCGNGDDPTNDFNRDQVEKIISREPDTRPTESTDAKDKSLYKIYKVMFRVNGVVHVAWCCPSTCDDWIRIPRPLFIGRKKALAPNPLDKLKSVVTGQPAMPQFEDAYETNFPYILFPYLISENDTISQLKGRVFLDQDLQEAVSSLLSSTVTQARRAAGLYFSKEVDDPNDDLLLQKNIFFRSGCLINSKVKQLSLLAPDPSMFSAIQMLVTANQNETSQVNFAAMNRQDSRKTAKEITVAQQQQQTLSTVQVVLFSIALTQMYRLMVDVIKSRVLAGLIQVPQNVLPYYQRRFVVKPSGDIDVIEKQEIIKKMMDAWPVVQNTPFSELFLMDLLGLMFPERVDKYKAVSDEAKAQAQSAQAQQMQQFMAMAQQISSGIIMLAKHKDYFSEVGQLHALPVVEQVAEQLKQLQGNTKQ